MPKGILTMIGGMALWAAFLIIVAALIIWAAIEWLGPMVAAVLFALYWVFGG